MTAWPAPGKNSCDVVLTDLKMPGLSGLELVEQLHAAKPKLPIIMMTAFGTTETAIEATKLGAYDYLLKPFEMGELLDLRRQGRGQQPAHVRTAGNGQGPTRPSPPSSATAARCRPSTRKSGAWPPPPSRC